MRVLEDAQGSQRVVGRGLRFMTEPRTEAYGRFVVFLDIVGNPWHLVGARE
jgi:hypothetical protein